jgi:hypothetical protein
VTELAISELVHLQANHLYFATRFEEVDQVLFCRFYRHVTDPESVAILWLLAFRLVATAVQSLYISLSRRFHLVHVREVKLDSRALEFLTCFAHRLVDTFSVLEHDMSKIAPFMVIAQTDLSDRSAVLEELTNVLLLRLLF